MDSVIPGGMNGNDISRNGQDQQQALATLPFCYEEAIAVVGYACRFPGAENSHVFWQNLLHGRECSQRSSCADMLSTGGDAAMTDAPDFDAVLFGYAESDAAALDPQQRLFLQIAWHALEHAAFAPTDVPHKTGVFTSAREVCSALSDDRDHVAPQLACKLNLRGPVVSLNTACCSFLVAVHMACESLRSAESDMAIAGGVAISLTEYGDKLALPGTLFSTNGVAAIVLRRLADALDDGDPILAILPSSAMNNDVSQRTGHTVPSVAGQREVISSALAQAGIDSTQVGLIEAQGEVTPLGDPIELQALCTVFHAADAGPPCALGSVKGNLGCLDGASGIASMLKAIMAVEHAVIPPSLHVGQGNAAQKMADSPFYVPTQAHSWTDATRIAGVSSFNVGGTNCHVLVSSLPPALRQAMTGSTSLPETSRATPNSSAAVLLLSAASETALRQLAAAYALALEKMSPHDLAYTALHGRQLDLPYRLALSLRTVEDATAALAGYANAHPEPLLYRGHGAPGKLVWVCSGEGTQWVGMGQSLYRQSVVFAQTLERCFDACGKECANQLRKAVFGFSGEQLAQPTLAQPVIIAFQIAMAAHWRALGLEPEIVLGQGIGEYAAAVIAGHFSIEQILPVVCTRARLLQDWQAVPDNVVSQVATVPDYAATTQTHEVTAILSRVCANLNAVPSSVRMISSVTGALVSADQLNADAGEHWCRHLLEPDCLSTALLAASSAGATVFLELGADASLSSMAHQCMWPVLTNPDSQACWIASARRQQLASVQLEQAMLQLYVAGFDLRWQEILPSSGRKVQAPLYVFDTNAADVTDAMTSVALAKSAVTGSHRQPAYGSLERRCPS